MLIAGMFLTPTTSIINNAGNALVAQIAPETTQSSTSDVRGLINDLWASSGTPTSTLELLLGIAGAESDFDPKAEGTTDDFGLYQWTKTSWYYTDNWNDAYDIELSTLATIQAISKNELWRWSASREDRPEADYQGWFSRLSTTTKNFVKKQDILCSCVLYLWDRGLYFPPIRNFGDLQPNSMPRIGTIALFYYNTGGHHGGEVVKVTYEGFYVNDANFRKCVETRYRFISWIDWLRVGRGFYSSP